ncbi:MAG: hypothetical protein L0387_08050 [Acidobacteria bacterium]|nr:hypothetical protein [Acidobacteriota bacterium]
MALAPQQADAAASDHLAFCSPCFNRYMELLAELRQEQQAQKQPLWKDVLAWPKTSPMWIGSAVMVIGLLSIAAYFLALMRESPKPDVVPRLVATRPGPIEYSLFELDLRDLSPTRAPIPEVVRPSISIPRQPLEISLLLPVGSEEGVYRVSVKAEGKTLWTAQSQARLVQQKTTMQVRVNLAEFPPGSYTLEVESESGFHLRKRVALQSREAQQEGKKQ